VKLKLAAAPFAAALRTVVGAVVACTSLWGQAAQIPDNFVSGEHPAIQYGKAPLDDPATRLMKQINAGTLKLERAKGPNAALGYLPAILKAFDIDPASQQLVFSKTSFQATRISPRNPRAIYFNDAVTIGYVRGSDTLEVTSLDPKQGIIFYTFDNSPPVDPKNIQKPSFDRRDVCLQCHHSPGTLGVPGLMIASVYPDGDGLPAFRGAQALTDHRTPLEERWGGWYVTGTHGDMRHRGNAMGHDRAHPDVLDMRDSQNQVDLTKKFDQAGYLEHSSDIVALLTHEHQIRMINYIVRTGWESRILARDPSNTVLRKQLDDDIDDMVGYLLFSPEARFSAKVAGNTAFAKNFTARGPKDSKGRSLRDFNLTTRLFEYPLSYMIYSEAFDALPDTVREQVYSRLHSVLTGRDNSVRYVRLSAETRQAILEILRETKKGLPAAF
jgi:hypothetical protein